MASLSCCVYMTQNLSNPKTNGSPPPSQPHSLKSTEKKPQRHGRNLSRPRQPSIIEIERAIGAGRFRDADPRDLEVENNAKFDISTLNFPGKFEEPLQKNIRQSAEWMTQRTERAFRLSGKKILMVTFMWILPIWTFSLLVACGVIKLPFSNQFLDQLLM